MPHPIGADDIGDVEETNVSPPPVSAGNGVVPYRPATLGNYYGQYGEFYGAPAQAIADAVRRCVEQEGPIPLRARGHARGELMASAARY